MATSAWGRLSKEERARAAQAGDRWGLSRDATRGRFNRGTYDPLSSDPVKALPREVRRYTYETGSGEVAIDWQAAAERNMILTLGDFHKFNEHTVAATTDQMSDALAEYVATASQDDLLNMASMQPDADGNPPPLEDWNLPPNISMSDLDFRDENGNWINPFWYH